MQQRLNSLFDQLITPNVVIEGRVFPAYSFFGMVGFLIAIAVVMLLCIGVNLSPLVMFACVCLILLVTYLQLTLVEALGKERLSNYHHQIVLLPLVAVFLSAIRQPILLYLDVIALGMAIFFMVGRFGCLMAGCCYGRPHDWGICYHDDHIKNGFPLYLDRVRLFPVQILEAVLLAFIFLIGLRILFWDIAPGAALAWYIVAYSQIRFWIEFLRGDAGRPYVLGFSETQWLSLIFTVVVFGFGLVGILPFGRWALGAISLMVIAWLQQRFVQSARSDLFHPEHVQELAQILEQMSVSSGAVEIKQTQVGLKVSAGQETDGTTHYTLSHVDQPLTWLQANKLAVLIQKLRHYPSQPTLMVGNYGVYHVLFIL